MSDCHCHNLCAKTNLGEFRDLNGVELDNIIEKKFKKPFVNSPARSN